MLERIGTQLRDRAGGERGAALMIVLVTLMGLTILGGAGMMLTKTDLSQSESVEAGAEAFYAADQGLAAYLGTKANGTVPDTFTIGQSTVIVTPTQMLDMGPGRVLYRLRSVATHTDARGFSTSRAVRAMAIYHEGAFKVNGAFTAISGLQKNGAAGTLTGIDQATPGHPECPTSPVAPVAGVAVPPGEYSQTGGGGSPLSGTPPLDDSQSATDLMDEMGIDWADTKSMASQTADYVIPPDSWPSSIGPNEWPVIYVGGNMSVDPANSGQGMLIVSGNLAMSGSFEWDGAILAGGYVTSNGFQTVHGAIVTGLNEQLGETVPATDIGNGNKDFKYDSCAFRLATKAAFGGLALVPGSWAEEI